MRGQPGYWAGDLVERRMGTGHSATIIETHSRCMLAVKPNHNLLTQVNAAAADLLSDVDNEGLRGGIYDPGTEASRYRDLPPLLNCGVYSCDPDSPWPQGTNRDTNSLLREPFHTGTDLRRIDHGQVDPALNE